MTPALEALPKGHRFPTAHFDLSREWVSEYIAAVQDAAIGRLGDDLVPPMAIAALAVRSLLSAAALPPGAIHLGQELAFLRSVRVGERLRASARIASRGDRQGWVLMGIEMSVEDEDGEPIMTGRATVTMPLEGQNPEPGTGNQ